MLESIDDLLSVLGRLYLEDDTLPKPFLLLKSLARLRAGEDPRVVAKSVRTTPKRIEELRRATDALLEATGCDLGTACSEAALKKSRTTLGQLLLGVLAERTFESIYKTLMSTNELTLVDARGSRNETDYRVLNGQKRQVFRINIKFHGSRFRNAPDLVGLQPEDCFALATYKIYLALQKQDKEVLPYLFVIVGVPDLTGAQVGRAVPEDLTHLVALVQGGKKVSGKQDIEEHIVRHLLDTPQAEPFATELAGYAKAIQSADWYVLSARKAYKLLVDKLFQRVFALREKKFTRHYRNAEVDMHFSLKDDLTRLQDFLALLKEKGLQGVTGYLERGLY